MIQRRSHEDHKVVKRRKKYCHPRQKQLIMLVTPKIKRRNGDVMIAKKHEMKMEMIDGSCVIYAV